MIKSFDNDRQNIEFLWNVCLSGLPYAFKRSGLIEGAIVMAAVAYFSMKAMLLLIDCLHKVRKKLLRKDFILRTNVT